MNKTDSKNIEKIDVNVKQKQKTKRYLFRFYYIRSHFYYSSHFYYFSHFLSNYRWYKADPERNNFSAGIHASLPQATHPEGISHMLRGMSSCSLILRYA